MTATTRDALTAAWDALWAVVGESEHHRFGTPGYDMTLDHLYEMAKPALDAVSEALRADDPAQGDLFSPFAAPRPVEEVRPL